MKFEKFEDIILILLIFVTGFVILLTMIFGC